MPSRPAEPPDVVADLADLAEVERDLHAVDAALRRLDDGTYSSCASCGAVIDADLLAADPLGSHCVRCRSVVTAPSGEVVGSPSQSVR